MKLISGFQQLSRFAHWLGFGQQRCVHCGQPFFTDALPLSSPTLRLCPACLANLSAYSGPICPSCGVPFLGNPSSNKNFICPRCAIDPPPWQSVAYYGIYEGPLRDLILRLKFNSELSISYLLADLLLEACQRLPKPDILLPIPQHPSHLHKRGFNQAYEIALALAKLSGLAFSPKLLKRVKQSRPQEGLSAKQRKLNLKGAFSAHASIKNKTLWLVDDILTTGSTCASAVATLLNAGAKSVYVLVVARTPRN